MRTETKADSSYAAMSRAMRRWALLALIAIAPTTLIGCYGSFPLTHGVYEFNGSVGSSDERGDLVEQVVFWAFVIIPVYALAQLGDALILNLIEFWTGEHIVSSVESVGDTEVALVPSADGAEAVMTVTRAGEVVSEQRFVRVGDGDYEVRSSNGEVAGRVRQTANGDLKLMDAEGRLIRLIPAAAIPAASAI